MSTIEIQLPITLVFGQFNQLQMAFTSDWPVRKNAVRCMDLVLREDGQEIHLDLLEEDSWKQENLALKDLPWSRQFLSAIINYGVILDQTLKIAYVERDQQRLEQELITLAFAGLLPEDERVRRDSIDAIQVLLSHIKALGLL